MYLQKPGNKYHAKSTIYDGVAYHSKLEAAYAEALTLSKRAGEIKGWERQVKLDLRVNGYHINNYYIDFVVEHCDGRYEFVEVKGMQLEPWKTNWKVLEATFEDHKRTPDDTMTLIQQSSWGPPRKRSPRV